MSGALEQAQNCLAIHSVNLRENQVEVGADIDLWNYDRSQAQPQSYRDVGRVQEVELQMEDERKSLWEYRFDYALGVRLVDSETDDAEDDPTVDLEIVAVFQARYLCQRQLEKTSFPLSRRTTLATMYGPTGASSCKLPVTEWACSARLKFRCTELFVISLRRRLAPHPCM